MQQLNSVRSYKGDGAKRPGAKRLWCESTWSWVKRPGSKRLWGKTSIGRIVQGRIDQVMGKTSRGETSSGRAFESDIQNFIFSV